MTRLLNRRTIGQASLNCNRANCNWGTIKFEDARLKTPAMVRAWAAWYRHQRECHAKVKP